LELLHSIAKIGEHLFQKLVEQVMAEHTKPLAQQLLDETKKPLTMKDRIVGILIACILVGLCIAMWLKPDILGLHATDFTGRGGRTIATIIDLAWSRPVGAILGVVATLMIYGSFTKPGAAH
jgi:hypothetical protein